MNIYVNKKGPPNDSPFKLKPITMKKTNKPCKDNQKLTESKKKVKKIHLDYAIIKKEDIFNDKKLRKIAREKQKNLIRVYNSQDVWEHKFILKRRFSLEVKYDPISKFCVLFIKFLHIQTKKF